MDVKSEDDCSADMTLPSIGGSTTLSVTGDAWWRDGDGANLGLGGYDAPVSIDQGLSLIRTRSNNVFQ